MCSNAGESVGSGGAAERRSGFFSPVSLLLSLILLLLTACAVTPPVVKIGLAAPFEGQYREVGYDVIYSARLAVREINQAGGVGGYRVALVALDDGGDPELAQEAARSLVVDPAVVAVVGHWRPETTAAAAPIYAESGLLFLPGGDPYDPQLLSTDFIARYEAVTPFDETPGMLAVPAYEAFMTLWQEMNELTAAGQPINRQTMAVKNGR